MISFPNAKINLGLNVVSRRADGYHNIETVFYPIGLKDALEVVPLDNAQPDERYRFNQTGIVIRGGGDDNLVIQALNAVASRSDIRPVDIHLFKNIPPGAGLGGGSADASFMLKLLNEKFSLQYSNDELKAMAAEIGADCPFFIDNTPVFASGIGDVMEPVQMPDLSNYHLAVVKPPFGISTQEAYSLITPRKPEISIREAIARPVAEWRNVLTNDFEEPLFEKYPDVAAIKKQLYDLGAVYVSMSGSGSAVFALFEEEKHVELHFSGCFVWQSDVL